MLVPAALRRSWSNDDTNINLHFYYIRFIPKPKDRQYRMFGLFIKNPLPQEAESLKVDLHLTHGRIVETTLTPQGMTTFDKEEVKKTLTQICGYILFFVSRFLSGIILCCCRLCLHKISRRCFSKLYLTDQNFTQTLFLWESAMQVKIAHQSHISCSQSLSNFTRDRR